METLTRMLFEQPYLQGTLFGIALVVALAGWWWARYEPSSAKRWALATVIIAILGVAGQITASLVTTDRERIEAMLQQAAVCLENADAPPILAMTDESLNAQGLRKPQFASWLEELFRRVRIHSPSIQKLEVTFESPSAATAIVSGIATIEMQGYRQIASDTWKFDFDKIAGQWKIVALAPQEGNRRLP